MASPELRMPRADLINCCMHPLNLFGATATEPFVVMPVDQTKTIRLTSAPQLALLEETEAHGLGFKIVDRPRFVGLSTGYVPKAKDAIVVSALAAQYIRENCPEYDEVIVFSPESDKLAVRDGGGQIIGCRALVCWPLVPKLLPPPRNAEKASGAHEKSSGGLHPFAFDY